MTTIKRKSLFPFAVMLGMLMLLFFAGCGGEGSQANEDENTLASTDGNTQTTPAVTQAELANLFATVNNKTNEARRVTASAVEKFKAGDTEAGNQTFGQAQAIYDECIAITKNILSKIEEMEKGNLNPVQREFLDVKKGEASSGLLYIQAANDIIGLYLGDPTFSNPDSAQKFNSLNETLQSQYTVMRGYQEKAMAIEEKNKEEAAAQSGQESGEQGSQ